jgi:hypothetical protein
VRRALGGRLGQRLMTTCTPRTRKSAMLKLNTLGVAPKLRQNRFKYSATVGLGRCSFILIGPLVNFRCLFIESDRFLKFGSHLFLTGTQRVIAKTIESQPEGKVAIRINVVQSRCNRSVIK